MDKVFYKLNVPYRVGVRSDIRDTEGMVLSESNLYVEVEKEDLRKFLQANKYAIEKGLIIEVAEPPMITVTTNSITDDEALALVKNFHALRKRLPEVTSETTVLKLLNAAKMSKRPESTIKLIMERFEEVSPSAMQGVN